MPTPKRFAFVIADLYGGGAEKSLLYTADGLRQRGHVVKVFILRDKIEHRLPEGLEIENLGVINRFSKLFSSIWVEKWQAKRIARALSTFGPDVVLSCSCDKITRHLTFPNLWFWIKSDISAKFSDPGKRMQALARHSLSASKPPSRRFSRMSRIHHLMGWRRTVYLSATSLNSVFDAASRKKRLLPTASICRVVPGCDNMRREVNAKRVRM
ncbi:glycosyltransferase [Chromohalobacter sp. TMW 2.2308]|uniref:glycosyltransferase n=1 Tax=Chromohalobacter moromii TaxID=2860329 RepID=UPI001FFD417A|nr:glycosyltransferase [Chromohalobacter moromii]MCK2042252.1 glycosyltransferase [Chromohalobacter moromii]